MTDLQLFLFGAGITALVVVGVVLAVMEFNQAHAPKGHRAGSQPISDQSKSSRMS